MSSTSLLALREQAPRDVVVMAASLGGLRCIETILTRLPRDFPAAVVIVQHLSERAPTMFAELLAASSSMPVQWLRHRQHLQPGVIHVAPPGFHATIDSERTAVLSRTPPVNFARPAADLLFASAASALGARAVGVVLTGRLSDGAKGSLAIRRAGGVVIAQDPATCAAPGMPRAAIAMGAVHFVLPPNVIAHALVAMTMMPGTRAMFGWPRVA